MATATTADDTWSEEMVATDLPPPQISRSFYLCRGSGLEQTSHDTGLTSQKAVSVFQEARAQVRASLILSAHLGLRFRRLLYLSEREASQWSCGPRRRHGVGVVFEMQYPALLRYLDTHQAPGTQRAFLPFFFLEHHHPLFLSW